MVEKGKSDKAAEEIQYATYKSWCANTQKDKQAAIATTTEKMDVLQADIAKYTSDAESLGEEIAGLDEDISTWEGDVTAATKVRDIESNDYIATHADYSSSIEALDKGIDTLKAQNHDVAQASAAMLQLASANFITPQAKRAIDQFVGQDPSIQDEENLAVAAPEANAFTSQLQGIIDMLSGLSAKFTEELTGLEKQEGESKHAFEMLSMDLKTQLEAANEARTEKAEKKADALQMAADAKGALGDASTTRDDDSKYVADVTAECDLKASAFADRQETRTKELEALGKAIEILAGGKVAGASEKHLPQLLQLKATSLLQVQGAEVAPSQKSVATYLRSQARKIGSRVLAVIAERTEADPFKKVKKMIKDLIVKLMEQANEEAETKGFCDKELQTNEHTRKEKTARVEQLTADVDELSASIAMLAEEIGKISEELTELEAAIGEAKNIRVAENTKNAQTIKDAKDAQEAVSNAMLVLRDFYDKAAEANALIQRKQPAIFDAPYRGMGAESGGIMGMIEVIGSDFMRLETETRAQEDSTAKTYKEYLNDAEVNQAQMNRDVEHKREKQASQEQALQETKSDLAGTEKELSAAMEVFEKLKPTCVGGGTESFEDRTAQRKEEIESLQEALRILNGEDIALLQFSRN